MELVGTGGAPVAIAPAVREVKVKTRDGSGGVLKVVELRRSRVVACMRRSGWKGRDDAGGLATLKMLVFLTGVVEAIGIAGPDGKPLRAVKDAELGAVMPLDLFDEVDPEAIEQAVVIAAPETFALPGAGADDGEKEEQAGN